MKKQKAIPKRATDRKQEKMIKTPEVATDNQPSWRFSTVDKNGPYAWPKGQPLELVIIAKLHDFDSMKWSEFLGSDHHNLSPESLSDEASRRLTEIGRDDEIENLYSFHIQGEPRFICIRDRDIAKLLWYDPKHGVSRSNKR